MSHLASISIQHLRNLVNVTVDPSPTVNVLYGKNGSGKTSFLEAVHLLGLGRSFRTRHVNRIISYQQSAFVLHAKLDYGASMVPIGLEKKQNGQAQIRLSGANVTSIATLAELLPIQVLVPDGHLILTGNPKHRRQFIDWGVFHVEHTFVNHWQRAERALKQRNIALKNQVSDRDIELWNQELCMNANSLHLARSRYFEQLVPQFQEIMRILLPDYFVEIDYFCGWGDAENQTSLLEVLHAQLKRDRMLGYTQQGPHRADVQLTVDGVSVTDALSQGQQKLVMYAMKLAQGILLRLQTDKRCVYLLDDLPAELDADKRQLIMHVLSDMMAQVFVTGTDYVALEAFADVPETRMFHVEHGVVSLETVAA